MYIYTYINILTDCTRVYYNKSDDKLTRSADHSELDISCKMRSSTQAI